VSDFSDVRSDQSGSGALLGMATAAASASTVTVDVGGQVITCGTLRGITIAQYDPVLVIRVGSRWIVIGRIANATPGSGNASDDSPVASTAGTAVFAPVETRSWRGSWRTDTTSVYQGEYSYGNHTGCAFYGGAPRALAGATVTSAAVYVKRLAAGTYAAQTTTLRKITESTRPAGAPTVSDSATGPSLAVGAEASVVIPTAWAQALVDGTIGGLGIYEADGSPYVRLAGLGEFSPAWTMTINWSR